MQTNFVGKMATSSSSNWAYIESPSVRFRFQYVQTIFCIIIIYDFCTNILTLRNILKFVLFYKYFMQCSIFICCDKLFNLKLSIFSLEKFGGICDCQSTRDTFLYAASVDSRGLDAAVEIIADVVLRPQMTDAEIDMARYAVKYV